MQIRLYGTGGITQITYELTGSHYENLSKRLLQDGYKVVS